MDSLVTCFVAHVKLTLCYGFVQSVDALPLVIDLSFPKKRLILVRCLYCFLTEWMPCLFSTEFSGGQLIRTSQRRIKCSVLVVFDTQSSFTHTHIWIKMYEMAKDSILVTVPSAFCLARSYTRMQAYLLLDTRTG